MPKKTLRERFSRLLQLDCLKDEYGFLAPSLDRERLQLRAEIALLLEQDEQRQPETEVRQDERALLLGA